MPPSVPSTEAEAYELLERLRWAGGPPSCPLCGVSGRCYFLRPVHGRPRTTRTGAATDRRVWKCGACRRQFSVLVGTVLQGTRISLRAWIAVAADWAAPGPPPRVTDIAERHRMSRAAARHVNRRLEAAVPRERDDAAEPLLMALLNLPPAQASRIRDRTPSRVRPRRQGGPTADYGEG